MILYCYKIPVQVFSTGAGFVKAFMQNFMVLYAV